MRNRYMSIGIPIVVAIFLVCGGGVLFSAPAAEEKPETNGGIVATTSWSAAFVYAAGVEDVGVLAPYDLRHPPEYEFRPSDVELVGGAGLVVYAGYERMVEKIRSAAGGDGPELLQIVTQYDMATIRDSVVKIAEMTDTLQAAEKNIAEIESFYDDWKNELEEYGAGGIPVVCHAFQRPLIEELGFEVAGVFGPAPLEAREIDELTRSGAELIIDNYHNDVGKPLVETMQTVPAVVFINFPGAENTVSLPDVLRVNRNRLRELLEHDDRFD